MPQVSVIVGPERRRRWRPEEKLAILADGIDNLKELIAIHKDDPSILEERRATLAAATSPKTEQPDQS